MRVLTTALAVVLLFAPAKSLPAQALGPQPFDLSSLGRYDGNGFMLNPGWKTPADFRILDPMARCGILALAGTPGFRNVLLRRGDCFGDAQRELLRLNEARSLRVLGGGCAQATEDGSVQGHVNWFPVTLTGTLHYNKTSDFTTQKVGHDYDHTFELTGDAPLPVTKWNVATRSRELSRRLSPDTAAIHVELDLRETTRRVLREWTGGGRWWGRLRELGERRESDLEADWQLGSDLMGTGLATVTGLFGLDIVHNGHAEIHPVFGLAILRRREVQTGGAALVEEWVVLARDRGNEGNCAHGIVPLGLGGPPRELDTFRLRIPMPTEATGRPTIAGPGRTWFAATAQVTGPEFWWTPAAGLDLVAIWPRPNLTKPDALLLGVVTVTWPGRFTPGIVAVKKDVPLYKARDETKGPERKGEPPEAEVKYYTTLAAKSPLVPRDSFSRTVLDPPPASRPDTLVRAVPILDIEPAVTVCEDVPRATNPRCVGDWSLVPGVGARLGGRIGSNYLLAFGVNSPHLGAGNIHPTILLEYRRFGTTTGVQAKYWELQLKSSVPACGNLAKLPGAYCVIQAGAGLERLSRTQGYFSPALGVGVRAPAALRMLLAIELQYRYLFRKGSNRTLVTTQFTLPIVAF